MVVPADLLPSSAATVTDRLEAGSETIPLECPGQPTEDARADAGEEHAPNPFLKSDLSPAAPFREESTTGMK